MNVLTHSGSFHTDETTAFATVWAAVGGDLVLRRSRDTKYYEWADVILDVGGKYVPTPRYERGKDYPQRWLDHHQPEGAGARPDGVPYATAGLAWKEFGHAAILATIGDYADRMTAADIDLVHARVDARLIAPIDAGDNGYSLVSGWRPDTAVRPYSVSAVIGAMNRPWDVPLPPGGDPDDDFMAAVLVAGKILAYEINSTAADVRASAGVRAAYAARVRPGVLVLPTGMPWRQALLTDIADRDVMYVLFPEPSTGWMVQAAPTELVGFESRRPLPAAWAGLRDDRLREMCGVADAVFCHRNRFICGAKTRGGAERMADIALATA